MLKITFNYVKCDISGMNLLKRYLLLGYRTQILTILCGKSRGSSDKHFRIVSFLISGVVLILLTSKYKINNVQYSI